MIYQMTRLRLTASPRQAENRIRNLNSLLRWKISTNL
jgi:hypothetical protein